MGYSMVKMDILWQWNLGAYNSFYNTKSWIISNDWIYEFINQSIISINN